MLLLVGSVAASARLKDGERNLGCEPQSGSAQPVRPGPFCTGTLAAIARNRRTRGTIRTSTSGHRKQPGRSRVEDLLGMQLTL